MRLSDQSAQLRTGLRERLSIKATYVNVRFSPFTRHNVGLSFLDRTTRAYTYTSVPSIDDVSILSPTGRPRRVASLPKEPTHY